MQKSFSSCDNNMVVSDLDPDNIDDNYWHGVYDALRMVDSFVRWAQRNPTRAKSIDEFLNDALIAVAKRCRDCLAYTLNLSFTVSENASEVHMGASRSPPPGAEEPAPPKATPRVTPPPPAQQPSMSRTIDMTTEHDDMMARESSVSTPEQSVEFNIEPGLASDQSAASGTKPEPHHEPVASQPPSSDSLHTVSPIILSDLDATITPTLASSEPSPEPVFSEPSEPSHGPHPILEQHSMPIDQQRQDESLKLADSPLMTEGATDADDDAGFERPLFEETIEPPSIQPSMTHDHESADRDIHSVTQSEVQHEFTLDFDLVEPPPFDASEHTPGVSKTSSESLSTSESAPPSSTADLSSSPADEFEQRHVPEPIQEDTEIERDDAVHLSPEDIERSIAERLEEIERIFSSHGLTITPQSESEEDHTGTQKGGHDISPETSVHVDSQEESITRDEFHSHIVATPAEPGRSADSSISITEPAADRSREMDTYPSTDRPSVWTPYDESPIVDEHTVSVPTSTDDRTDASSDLESEELDDDADLSDARPPPPPPPPPPKDEEESEEELRKRARRLLFGFDPFS